MSLARVEPGTSVIDVLDHVLDKGIVIDAWLRLSVVGIDLLTVEARVVVASMHTYLARAGAVARLQPASSAPSPFRRLTLEDQLRRAQQQLAQHDIELKAHRRREDRLRDEHHDAHAMTLRKARPHA